MSGQGDFDPGPDDPDDAARFEAAQRDLIEAVAAAVPAWTRRIVVERVGAWHGSVSEEQRREADHAGKAAADEAVESLGRLFALDLDDQATNPLAVLRRVTSHAHRVLADAGVPPLERDEFAERTFPDDVYDLMPATWSDVDPALAEPGMTWSAAKAYMFKSRRRRENRT